MYFFELFQTIGIGAIKTQRKSRNPLRNHMVLKFHEQLLFATGPKHTNPEIRFSAFWWYDIFGCCNVSLSDQTQFLIHRNFI